MYRCLSIKRQEKKEEEYETLIRDIDDKVSFYTQSERCHNNTLGYVKLSARQILEDLLKKGYALSSFCKSTINNILNRLGYTLKKVQKTKPLKRIAETEKIFQNLKIQREKGKQDIKTLQISVDIKDKVKIGELSRKGYNRSKERIKANDKDQQWTAQLIPMGILEMDKGQGTIVFGNSKETSDFIVDSLEMWYEGRYRNIRTHERIQILLDCGPHNNSRRTQFMKRIAQWAVKIKKRIHLLYYPPYHSKYNPIERFWSALEQYWNGTILNTISKTLSTATNMKWKGVRPFVYYHEQEYQNGVKLTIKQMEELEKYLTRNQSVGKWDVIINPSEKLRTLFLE